MQAEGVMEKQMRKITEAETIARENGCSLSGARRIDRKYEISITCRVVTPAVFEAFEEADAHPAGAYIDGEAIRIIFRW